MLKKLKNKKNYKILIGIILGFIVSTNIVYALFIGKANEMSYDSSGNILTATNVQDALDELYAARSCPFGHYCPELKPGEYVSYTPTNPNASSYPIDTSITGYTGNDQSNIIPNELTSWRVLKVNQNGTVELISTNVSSTAVYFEGLIGYKNFIGYLNVLASQYETPGITVGSRHFGYNGQTEYITDEAYFTSQAPWKCNTGYTCTPAPDDYEAYGGGDTGYLSDNDLTQTVLGSRVAKKQGTSTDTAYWISSRFYFHNSNTSSYWEGRYMKTSGSATHNYIYGYNNGWKTYSPDFSLRPIVVLRSDIVPTGSGTEGDPWVIN